MKLYFLNSLFSRNILEMHCLYMNVRSVNPNMHVSVNTSIDYFLVSYFIYCILYGYVNYLFSVIYKYINIYLLSNIRVLYVML